MNKYLKYNSAMLATDKYAIVPQNAAVVYIFENDVDYHVNYQTDLTSLVGFDYNYTYYSNEFTSLYSEKIGAVGTYFNESGIEYSFDVYVNDEKVHTQSGVSEYAGFKTIKLDNYIPVYSGDTFKVVFNSNALPYQAYSRQHYVAGMSLVSNDAKTWTDLSTVNKTVCLKVYTVYETIEKQETSVKDDSRTNIIYNITDGNMDLRLLINATTYTKEKYTIEVVTGQRSIYAEARIQETLTNTKD